MDRFAHVCDINTCSKECIEQVVSVLDDVLEFMEEFIPAGAQYPCFISLNSVLRIIKDGTLVSLPTGYKEVFRGVYKVGNRLFTYDNGVGSYVQVFAV